MSLLTLTPIQFIRQYLSFRNLNDFIFLIMSEIKDPSFVVIEPKTIQGEYFKDLFRFRELLYFFSHRDIIVRYRQAFFGISWAIVRPLLTMLMFTLIFGRIAHLSSGSTPYSVYVLAGMIPWQLFANTTIDTCHSLLNNAHLITKIYFPRMIIPISQTMVHLVDFCVNIVFIALLMIFFQIELTRNIVFFPLFILLILTLCTGSGLWLSALTVKYRDFKIIIPFVMQFGMFLSPVGYGTFVIPEEIRLLYFLNPLVGIIDGFRWCLFETTHPYIFVSIGFSICISLFLLVSGYMYFRSTERSFADQV
ncbi:ABC-2 type transporter [Chlamydiales bacterium STE3]|nr:ABC-2 type transporter [Chlamydiales bacterium STE3]